MHSESPENGLLRPNKRNQLYMLEALSRLRGYQANLMSLSLSSYSKKFKSIYKDFLIFHRNEIETKKTQLTPHNLQEIILNKCHGFQVTKNGLYYQKLTFSPICGLLKSSQENPNVRMSHLSKFATMCTSKRLIKKGETLSAAFFVDDKNPEFLFDRICAGDFLNVFM